MTSYLHARKKPHAFHVDDEDFSNSSSYSEKIQISTDHSRKKKKGRRSTSELKWAAAAVVGFILVGLSLGFFLLHHQHRKVIVHILNDPLGHGKGMLRGRAGFHHHFYTGSPRYVTVVMPSVVNPKGRTMRLKSIQDTWGPYARSIFVVHNVSEFPEASHQVLSEELTLSDPYSYPQLLVVPPNISFDDGLPRLYYTIQTVYERINPDFAFFVNDHTFVLPLHLCKFLEHRHPDHDLYAGHALINGKSDVFNSGAAGYVLSRSAMQKMIQKWHEEDPKCWLGSDASPWLQGNPGLVTAQCLHSLNIDPIDTRAKHKWHRFHAFPLTRVVAGKVDEWYINKHSGFGADTPGGFDDSYRDVGSGEDCCSMDTISFHYVEYMESRALFATRELLLKDPHIPDHELQSFMMKEWPTEFKELGGYSRGLPKENDTEGWTQLMAVLRKISLRGTQRDC